MVAECRELGESFAFAKAFEVFDQPEVVQLDGALATEFVGFPSSAPQAHRSIEEIPFEELQNATLDTLERYISFLGEDLKREVAKQFGIPRLGKHVTSRLDETLGLLGMQGRSKKTRSL